MLAGVSTRSLCGRVTLHGHRWARPPGSWSWSRWGCCEPGRGHVGELGPWYVQLLGTVTLPSMGVPPLSVPSSVGSDFPTSRPAHALSPALGLVTHAAMRT